jgi:hypothetical protein
MFTPAPASHIWFMLLESATGEPYKRTNADKVSVAASADVADFRDAAHRKHTNKLSSFDAADLLVYRNRTAFDKRNADDGKEEPLKSSCNVVGLGETEEEALVVVVPFSSGDSLLPFIFGSQSSLNLSLSIPLYLLFF